MCVIHTASYAGCPHIHSYPEIVHENAIYCPDQQVIHNGTSRQQEKCPECVKKTQKPRLPSAPRLETKRAPSADDNTNTQELREQLLGLDSGEDGAPVVTDGLVFIENYFGNGKGSEEAESSQASGLVEWQFIDQAVAEGDTR